ncbi:hypothetical protein K432DRAFT_449570, partial [Lepidopterella palustris CBS 459.81]
KAQLEALEPQRPRKRVAVNPNTRFAQIESIRATVEESKRIKAERATKKPLWDAQKVAAANAALELQDMCTEWQL